MAVAQPKWAPNWARRPLRLLEGLLTSRYGWTPFGLILAFYVAVQIHDGGSDLRRWDVLLISGWAVLVVGLVIAQTVPQCATHAGTYDRGSLEVTQRELDELWTDFSAGAGCWGLRTGWVTAAAVFLAFVLATRGNLALKATLVVLESLGAYVAGFHLGRMAGFGRLGALPALQGVLNCSGKWLRLQPIGTVWYKNTCSVLGGGGVTLPDQRIEEAFRLIPGRLAERATYPPGTGHRSVGP